MNAQLKPYWHLWEIRYTMSGYTYIIRLWGNSKAARKRRQIINKGGVVHSYHVAQ